MKQKVADGLSERLKKLGHVLPSLAAPVASYVPAKVFGNLIFVSGQLPLRNGNLLCEGPLQPGSDLKLAQESMACCFLNSVAAAAHQKPLDSIVGVLRLEAFVASSSDFTQSHVVANGASDLAEALFGKEGLHTRYAIGVPCLPLGASVELAVTFYV